MKIINKKMLPCLLAIVLIVTCFMSTGCMSSYFDDVDDELEIVTDGENLLDEEEEEPTAEPTEEPTPEPTAEPTAEPTEEPTPDPTAAPVSKSTYVLNTNTKKFHVPSCSSVSKMKAKNKKVVEDTKENIVKQGYDPCGNCHP